MQAERNAQIVLDLIEHQPTMKAWRAVLLADPCAYCGEPSREIDHVVPLHAAGEDDHSNLTAACKRCNREKSGQSLLAFLSGHDCGHARRLGAPPPTTSLPSPERPKGRWISVAEERSRWLFSERCYALAYKAKFGKLPPKEPLPAHLAWEDAA